jgi:small GTP-binding protein
MVLTGAGSGAIAVVRLVGAGVGEFLERCFSKRVRDGRCVHGELRWGEKVVDDPVVVVSGGATVADVNVHGGPWVVRSVIEMAREAGFDVVERAGPEASVDFMHGETVLEREVEAYLPVARTEMAVRTLLDQGRCWREWVEGKTEVDAREVLADRSLHWLLHPPRVAIVGVSNVGKSTLANRLFAQERSITADIPGTTRDWVGEIANVDGLAVMLVDTPGVRETADEIERRAIEGSAGQVQAADLVVIVLDPTQAFDGQRELIERWPGAVRVVNKADRVPVCDLGAVAGIATVATMGDGVDEVRREIKRRFGCDGMGERPRWWTRRQKGSLEAVVAGEVDSLRRLVEG